MHRIQIATWVDAAHANISIFINDKMPAWKMPLHAQNRNKSYYSQFTTCMISTNQHRIFHNDVTQVNRAFNFGCVSRFLNAVFPSSRNSSERKSKFWPDSLLMSWASSRMNTSLFSRSLHYYKFIFGFSNPLCDDASITICLIEIVSVFQQFLY